MECSSPDSTAEPDPTLIFLYLLISFICSSELRAHAHPGNMHTHIYTFRAAGMLKESSSLGGTFSAYGQKDGGSGVAIEEGARAEPEGCDFTAGKNSCCAKITTLSHPAARGVWLCVCLQRTGTVGNTGQRWGGESGDGQGDLMGFAR